MLLAAAWGVAGARRVIVAGGALLVAVAAAIVSGVSGPADDSLPEQPTRPSNSAAPDMASRSPGVAHVELERLDQRPQTLLGPERNPFRFHEPALPPAASRTGRAPTERVDSGGESPAPPAAASLPPIPLRFIGFTDPAGEAPPVGTFSDGRGNVFHGRQGDIIEGRYRVLHIGSDSAELAYLDGRGRQTIHMAGQ
jgi:hypothetical protein